MFVMRRQLQSVQSLFFFWMIDRQQCWHHLLEFFFFLSEKAPVFCVLKGVDPKYTVQFHIRKIWENASGASSLSGPQVHLHNSPPLAVLRSQVHCFGVVVVPFAIRFVLARQLARTRAVSRARGLRTTFVENLAVYSTAQVSAPFCINTLFIKVLDLVHLFFVSK